MSGKNSRSASGCNTFNSLVPSLYNGSAPFVQIMPRVVVDLSQTMHAWLESKRGEWKPRTVVLREIIEDAMHRDLHQRVSEAGETK
jgi:hypothetical protein